MFMNNEKVSIILPTHNRCALLPRAINSVLSQTYKNWELLVILDGCIDSTREVIRCYENDERIRWFSFDNPRGASGARNFGLDKASGYYIAFLDDDDEWLPEKLERQISLFNVSDNIIIVSCYFYQCDGQSVIKQELAENITISDLLYDNVCGSFSFCLTKKDFIKNLKINEKLKACQDWDFWIKLFQNNLDGKGLTCTDYLVKYYIHNKNRLSADRHASYESFRIFLKQYWDIMNLKQRAYSNYRLMCYMDENEIPACFNFVNKTIFFFKWLYFYLLSGYNINSTTCLFIFKRSIRYHASIYHILKKIKNLGKGILK